MLMANSKLLRRRELSLDRSSKSGGRGCCRWGGWRGWIFLVLIFPIQRERTAALRTTEIQQKPEKMAVGRSKGDRSKFLGVDFLREVGSAKDYS